MTPRNLCSIVLEQSVLKTSIIQKCKVTEIANFRIQELFRQQINETCNNMEFSLPAQKGGTPLKRMYKMTPALHTSISFPYFLLSTSGAT